VAPTKVNPAVPPALSDTILRMLSKRPELRPVHVAEVLEALADGREPPSVEVEIPALAADAGAAMAALLDFDDSFGTYDPGDVSESDFADESLTDEDPDR